MNRALIAVTIVALAACSRDGATPTNAPQREPTAAAPAAPAPPAPPAAPAHAGAVDPKSSAAPVELAQRFADLLNARKFDEAWMLLGASAEQRKDFEADYARYSGLKVQLLTSPMPRPEGAAGSIYMSIPAHISGTIDGKHAERSATLVLRRVNDVPGSTEAQRRWHIERVDDSST